MPNKGTSDHLPACASCDLPVPERVCYSENGKGAKGCPSLTRKSVLAETRKLYQDERIKHFAHMASAQEASGYGFEVVSISCKAGRASKDLIDITDDEKVFKGTDEAMCNPIFQAKVLDADKTHFNIILGLCVGHDTLFFQHTKTPTTVLAVKDRVTGHNPLAAVYQSESYYRKIRCPDVASPGIIGKHE